MLREMAVESVPLSAAGKVNRFRGKTRHFPRGVEMAGAARDGCGAGARPAAGESEPFSQENPALSPEVEMPSAARGTCRAGTPVGHGGK